MTLAVCIRRGFYIQLIKNDLEMLKTLKNDSNMSYTEIANKVGVSHSTVRRIFTGDYTSIAYGTIKDVVEAMGGTVGDVLYSQTPPAAMEPPDGATHTGCVSCHSRSLYERVIADKNRRIKRLEATRFAITTAFILSLLSLIAILIEAYGGAALL